MCPEKGSGGGVHSVKIQNRVAAKPGVLRGKRVFYPVYVVDIFAAARIEPGVEIRGGFFY